MTSLKRWTVTRVGGCASESVCAEACLFVSEITSRYAYYFWPLEPSLGRERERKRETERGRGNCYRAASQLCIYSTRIWKWPCTHPPSISRSLSGGWGQVSPTVVSAGLCGCMFILEPGLPSGSLHLSKHPSGRCSVFPASHGLPLSFSSRCSALLCSGLECIGEDDWEERDGKRGKVFHMWALRSFPLHVGSCCIEWRVPGILWTLASADCFCTYADVKFVI